MDEKDFEIAAQLEQMARENAIAKARKQAHSEPPAGFDGTCPLCEAEIPPARIAAGYYICVDCATGQEHRSRLGL